MQFIENIFLLKCLKKEIATAEELDLRSLGKVIIFRDWQTNRAFLLYIDFIPHLWRWYCHGWNQNRWKRPKRGVPGLTLSDICDSGTLHLSADDDDDGHGDDDDYDGGGDGGGDKHAL